MSTPPHPPSGNIAPTPDDVEEAIAAAHDQLETAAAHPSFAADPLRLIFTALAALLRGLERAYTGTRRQRSELAVFLLRQRTELVADFAKQHEAALARTKAEELGHEAKVKAGLIEAAKDALRELLQLDRKHTYIRAFAYAVLPAILLFLVGFTGGWLVRGARNVADVTNNIANLETLADITRQNTEIIRYMSELLIRGMTPTDFAALASLHNVVLTTIAKVPGDTVPAPCIAAVPQRTILVNGKPIKACVVALRDNATVQGGEFLTSAITPRSQAP